MSEEAETPQQRQLRIRQQKREAKLKASAQERLDKITSLSGRTPESMRNESPAPTPPIAQSSTPSRTEPGTPTAVPQMFGQTNDPDQMRMQHEYMKALLAGQPQDPSVGPQQSGMPAGEEDPMVKMLQSMLGGMSGDPNAPAGMPSADDLSKMTGMPSFLTSMVFGGQKQPPASPAEARAESMWKIVRIWFSILAGLYMIFIVEKSVSTFGHNPPVPATAQNPFVVFLTGELLLYGSRIALSGRPTSNGFKTWLQSGRDFARDGAILVFMLGVYSWSKGFT